MSLFSRIKRRFDTALSRIYKGGTRKTENLFKDIKNETEELTRDDLEALKKAEKSYNIDDVEEAINKIKQDEEELLKKLKKSESILMINTEKATKEIQNEINLWQEIMEKIEEKTTDSETKKLAKSIKSNLKDIQEKPIKQQVQEAQMAYEQEKGEFRMGDEVLNLSQIGRFGKALKRDWKNLRSEEEDVENLERKIIKYINNDENKDKKKEALEELKEELEDEEKNVNKFLKREMLLFKEDMLSFKHILNFDEELREAIKDLDEEDYPNLKKLEEIHDEMDEKLNEVLEALRDEARQEAQKTHAQAGGIRNIAEID